MDHPQVGAGWPTEFDQRYVEVSILEVTDAGITIQVPAAPVTTSTVNQVPALPGFYILFLVSNDGYVSDGRWVRVQ